MDYTKALRNTVQAFLTIIPDKISIAVTMALQGTNAAGVLASSQPRLVKAAGGDGLLLRYKHTDFVVPSAALVNQFAVETAAAAAAAGGEVDPHAFGTDGAADGGGGVDLVPSDVAEQPEVYDSHEKMDSGDVALYALHSSSSSNSGHHKLRGTHDGAIDANFPSSSSSGADAFASAAAAGSVFVAADGATGSPLFTSVVPVSPGSDPNAAVAAKVQALAEQFLPEFRRQAVEERQQLQLQSYTGGFLRVQRDVGDGSVRVTGEGDTVTGRVSFTAGDEYNVVLDGGSVLNASRVRCVQDMIVDGIYTAAPWLVYKVSERRMRG